MKASEASLLRLVDLEKMQDVNADSSLRLTSACAMERKGSVEKTMDTTKTDYVQVNGSDEGTTAHLL